MNAPKPIQYGIIIALLWVCSCQGAIAQTEIKGTVYDRSLINEIQGVSVMSSSGAGAITDSLGRYHIMLPSNDSIYFSYLGKRTQKFPVKNIDNPLEYNISLDAVVTVTLAPILVAPNSYHLDSLENRKENERIFDYGGAGTLNNMKSSSGRKMGLGLGFDMDAMFDAKVGHSRESVQRYFIEDERQAYVDHRFTKAIVKKLTGLQPPALDTFMKEYRPSYEFTQSCTTDIELYQYIQEWGKSFLEDWTEEHKVISPGNKPLSPTTTP